MYISRFGFGIRDTVYGIPKGPVISQTASTTPHSVTDEGGVFL
jgi:hypothetical protein